MVNDIELYNSIYTENQEKWNIGWRNVFIYITLWRYPRPDTIMDIGCGGGHVLKHIGEKWPKVKLSGVDISPVATEIAKENNPNGTFYTGRFEEMDLPHSDIVICAGVAEHFEDLDNSLKALKKTGDLFYLEVPNCIDLSPDRSEGFRKTFEGSGQHEWHLGGRTWEKHILDAGFEIVERIDGMTHETFFIWMLR